MAAAQIQIVPYTKQYDDEIANLILSTQQNEFGINITLADQPDLQDIDNFYRRGMVTSGVGYLRKEN